MGFYSRKARQLHILLTVRRNIKLYVQTKIPQFFIDFYNPAFDVTPAKLIAGIITEKGIIEKPTTFKVKSLINS